MQSRTLILILSIGALAAFGGCERHHWEDTRKLHQGHGGGHGHDGHHKEGEEKHHEGEKDHGGKKKNQGAKKDEPPKPETGKPAVEEKAAQPKGEPRKL